MVADLIKFFIIGCFKYRLNLFRLYSNQQEIVNKQHNLLIDFKSARLISFGRVVIRSVGVHNEKKGVKIHIDKLIIQVSLSKILLGRLHIASVIISGGRCVFLNNETEITKSDDVVVIQSRWENLHRVIRRYMRTLMNYNVKHVLLEDMQLTVEDTIDKSMYIKMASCEKKLCLIELFLKYKDDNYTIKSRGNFENLINGTDLLLNYSTDLNIEKLAASGSGKVRNISGKVNLDILCKAQQLIITESSGCSFNKIFCRFSLNLPIKDQTNGTLRLQLLECTLHDILEVFPELCYKDIYTAVFTGNLSFDGILDFEIARPFNMDTQLNINNTMQLVHAGSLNLDYLQTCFLHRVGEEDAKLKEILVSTNNPYFLGFDQIPDYIKNAVIVTEDPGFYTHRGMDPNAFGYAFMSNVLHKKFYRGASTITMQLVRNLFLHHHKDPFRKMEELLLTWLIETVFLVKKERLLEIYLNIIEFGENIYGITSAVEFYFAKKPHELNLTESLVLTYIIPRPKHFLKALQENSSQLKQNLVRHLYFYSRELKKNGLIPQEENIQYQIVFGRFGILSLDPFWDKLNIVLSTVYMEVERLWLERYPYLPKPWIWHCFNKDGQIKIAAFDAIIVRFKGGIDSKSIAPSILAQFSSLMAEVDIDNQILFKAIPGAATFCLC